MALEAWLQEIKYIVFGRAQSKGYAATDDGDGRDLLDFVKQHFNGHAEGEVVYKLIRWAKKRNPEDILKAAAWCFLVYDQHMRQDTQQETPDVTFTPKPDHRMHEATATSGGQSSGSPVFGGGGGGVQAPWSIPERVAALEKFQAIIDRMMMGGHFGG